ncbi:MAG: redox-sensing transcriptional repressor Rex [Anaerolineales bacterium]|nr:redox-sensing transcriptional repressor Rex [Anaerolineae bacterium]PWB50872.1 MAG: redox-sensing transcriptional repressor Rex [Anaerolineales bacterium]
MADKFVPNIVVGRLPLYLRTLQLMSQEGRRVTSSQELGEKLGISAAQIRKDLSQFGEFGKQGTGYNIDYLTDQLRKILCVNKVWDVAVVGIGDVGHALARYQGFSNRGFRVALLFDNDPQKIGTEVGGFVIEDISDMVSRIKLSGVQVAMLSVPVDYAQQVTNQLVEAGVKAILNYAPINISVPPEVHVQYIDPVLHLQRMTYYLD